MDAVKLSAKMPNIFVQNKWKTIYDYLYAIHDANDTSFSW